MNDDLLSIFILSIFCNILMFIAVDGFKNNPHEIGKYVGIFLGVTVFILCGFEVNSTIVEFNINLSYYSENLKYFK